MPASDSAPMVKGIPARSTPTMIGALILFLAALIVAIIYTELLGRAAYSNAERADDLLLTEHEINSALLDMETAVRGYVIAGDYAFLEPYNAANERLPQLWENLIDKILRLENLDGDTRSRLLDEEKALEEAANRWQTEWGDVQIRARREGRGGEALSAIASGAGKGLFDAFRAAGRAFNATIAAQLRQYNDDLNSTRNIELAVILALGLLALAGAILTMRTALRESRNEIEATRRIDTERRQLQAVVDNLPIAVRVVDSPESNVILQNEPAEEIFPAATWNKMTREERISYFDLRLPDGTPVTLDNAPVAKGLQEGRTVRDVELITTRPDTGTRHLMVSAAPIKDKEGAVTSSVILIQDVTRLKAMDQRKDEFIAIAAHELRNPLAALVGYNHLAQRTLSRVKAGTTGADDALPSIERHLGEMSKQIERLTKLVIRLLDASRIQLGRLVLERSPIDLVKLAEEAVANARTTDGGNHEIELLAPPALEGQWDSTRVQQVITNLLDNALHYSPPGTTVRIAVIEQGPGVARVEITDQGPGITDYQRPHLFTRYYGPIPLPPTPEGTQAPRKKRGLGLGLYVSAEIVEAHGGKIGVQPSPDGGSIFWFTLPITET